MRAVDILKNHEVNRLCHFTKFQSLTHIVASPEGLVSAESIRSDIKNVTDIERYDGELDYICCSVEYPNSWFLEKKIRTELNMVFCEWVVLFIDINILKHRVAKFCVCNASRSRGAYINSDIEMLDLIFAEQVPSFRYGRPIQMLSCCPTDGQAEILIKDNIPRSFISGIAVGDTEIAGRIFAMLELYDVSQIPIYISPEILTPAWSVKVKSGLRPSETKYERSEENL